MGFIITGSITDAHGRSVDNFYCRIGNYQIQKPMGFINVTMEHYTTKESASWAHPTYQEDILDVDASGLLTPQFTYNEVDYNFAHPFQFPLTESVQVEKTVYSSSFTESEVGYIDFDDDGNEIVKTRIEKIETIHTSSQMVDRSKINPNIITGSVYEYAYNEIRNVYKDLFGSNNVKDDI